jgi:prevent-host-death family protein
MGSVSVRDLRNHGGEVLTRVALGEAVIITRDGADVAELRPLRRHSVPTTELIARRAPLPDLDIAALRADLDSVLDATL